LNQLQSHNLNAKLQHIQGQQHTGGLLFRHGHVALDQEVLDIVESSRQQKTNEKYQVLKKKSITFQEMQALLRNGNRGEPKTNSELKAWIEVGGRRMIKTIPSKKQDFVDMKNDLVTPNAMTELIEFLLARKLCSDEEMEDFLSQFYDNLEAEDDYGLSGEIVGRRAT
jgi:hypothetical protein